MDNKERVLKLISTLNKASEAYYGGKEEILSNFEWDSLFDELQALEKETGIVYPNSPTQKVSDSPDELNSGERVAHEFPALSLAKTKSIEDLQDWAMDKEIWVSYKLDGLTLVITYDNGNLTQILTRGNGTEGSNITFLKNSISGFPLSIEYKGHMVVRGEATISYTDFENINALSDDEKYANPRNLASGTLSLDDPNKVKDRNVCFNAFTLVYIEDDIRSWGERMSFLEKLGFNVIERMKCTKDEIPEVIDIFTRKVEDGSMDIPVDGLVICYEDNDYAQGGSVTGHHATRAGLAFKWADVSAFSVLKYVEWSCAASTISPVAVFEPVQLEGTTVSRASLCNISEMERLGIGDGCTVEVIKANKIIPKVISVRDTGGCFEIPKVCPVCGSETNIFISPNSNTKTLHCMNANCTAKMGKKFARFVSKSGMDIDGLSIQTMLKFINMGFLKSFSDLYHLNAHSSEIMAEDGFGDKSVSNMLNAVEKSREVKAVNFIYALSIPMIGLDAAKKFINSLGFESFYNRLKQGIPFDDIDGIGPEKSASILNWYQNSFNAEEIDKLLNEVHLTDSQAKTSNEGNCVGLTFVITGDVHTFKNRDEFKAYVESNGGKVAGSVSGKTNYLVNNDLESSSSKNTKAKSLGIPIISEDEFIEKFGR